MEKAIRSEKREGVVNPLKSIPSAKSIRRSRVAGKWVIDRIDNLSQDLMSLRKDLLRRMGR
jgi:hypothetical protein